MSTEHVATSTNQLNKLRAAVLGANDGIVSTAGIILGVTGAAAAKETILLAGFAGLIAGAASMAAGEFVSVSSQRDSEKAFLASRKKSRGSAKHAGDNELVAIYTQKGMSQGTANQAVADIAKHGNVMLELEKEHGIDPDDLPSPWGAAVVSAVSFIIGALVPLAAIFFAPEGLLLPITAIAVIICLILTGSLSARAGQANQRQAALRVVIWGVGAMFITYAIGMLLGVSAA